MSEESAAPVGDDNSEMKPGEETMSQDQEEVCNKDTELMMLEGETIEDEKMPSYMNATSISSSTKPDDSRTENDGQTQPQFETNESTGEQERNEQNSEGDRSNSSVVELVTSGEESDRGFDGVEDEEDYTTDDDGRDFDDEDDEEEAEYLRRNNDEDDDEDYSESEIEAEQFERSSDDFVQRPSEVLESQARERSRSLQDLTSPTRRIGKFNSNRQHSELDGRADFNLGGQRRCFLGGPKYGHITSKVKQYIHGMKEQSRLSRQRRSRDPLDVNRELANVIKRDQAMETDIRVNPQSRLLKSYMENNMKHMIVEDPTRAEDMTVNRHLVENGAEIISVDTGETLKKSYDTTMVMEVDKENEICPDKHQHQLDKKPNGVMIVDYPGLSPVEPKPSVNLKDNQEVKVETLTNGKDEMKQITNCQSVSYEDFIKGNFDGNQDQKTEKQRKPPSDPLELTAIIQENMSAAPSALKIQQGEPISQEIVISTRNPTENPAVVLLKAQLNKKVVECDGIKEDYKRIVNKNFQLRNDYNLMADKNLQLEKKLSDLTKTLAQYQKEKTKEMRAVEVQTEPLSTVIDKSLVVSQPKVEQEKMSNNSFRSIGSGPSSIEQWTDSNCSPSISLKPPNVGSILNSDDSLCLGTPPKTTPRPISQAFYTSSRILQTLANITQGKSDPANPNTGGRRNNAPDAGDKTTVESPASHKNDGNKRDEDDVEEIEVNDGIKCYVYKEDMDSKERSFLLQAEETNKIGNNGVVRECGPFLLANLEVRMSEANGTLNIWGREINQESTSVDVEGADLEEDVLGNEAFWPKTPAEKLRTTPFVCSTNKKQKSGITTAGIRSRVPKKLRTVLNRVAGSYDDQVDRPFGSMPNLDNPGVQNCLSCHQKQGGHSPIQMAPRKSSCCPHNHEVNNYECETVQNTCGAVHNMTCRGISVSNPANLHVKHSCMNYAQNEVCKHQLSSHPLTGDTEEIYCQVPKRCHSIDIPCNSRGENNCPRGRAHSDGQPVFVGDTAPLMQSGSSEGSDNSNRRLSGKRVRGFLRDFLKGCGDCRHSHTTSLNTGHLQASETPIPDIRITAAPDSGLHHQPHSSSNDRAPNSIADFQLQFEQLMVDVEKINTRSRTLFQMMNTLCNVDSQ
ncbi:probable serine/threonine-protein kinase kinX isoform X2 [Diachasmimorpha longicaudata]|uniref:probable serine/threonine-protein kinase kinX isoform X2 n=1 Tax=Diachasmimorpha longicaudata TaxID=58733 RepID=UPI0030B8E68B